MRVFAQNEQRQRKARQYLNLYERRDKERVNVCMWKSYIVGTKATKDS